ncbi:MAG: sulfatase [Planctomycetota bacterium]
MVLLLAAGATAYVALFTPRDLSQLVRILDESCYDLHLHLDQAVPLAGFPSRRLMQRGASQHLFINRDTSALALYVPFAGELLFPQVPLHPHARLTWQAGIEPFQDLAPLPASGRRCRFEIVLRPAQRAEVVLDQATVELNDARGTLSAVRTCALPTDLGDHVDVVLRTTGTTPPDEPPAAALAFLPTWRSPVIRSDGRRDRLEQHKLAVTTLVRDLLDGFRASGNDVLIQRRLRPQHDEPTDIQARAIDFVPNFDTLPDVSMDGGGEWPSVVFAASGQADFSLAAVPGDGELRFSFGLEGFATKLREPSGAAVLRVLLDGATVWERSLSGQSGWTDVSLGLFPRGRKAAVLTFAISLEPIAPQPIEVGVLDTATYQRASEPRELLVRRAAVARPRIVTQAQTPRRLSGDAQPNVIVLVSETLRADFLGCYGATLGITPEIDALAKRGLLYERAYAAASWTLASTASILTGRDPILHGAVKEDRGFLSDANETLGEAAQKLGATTAAFTTNDFVQRERNFDQGFETFAYRLFANARQLNQLFFDWLDDHRDVQFLAYLHYWDPHDPCNAPGELERKHVRPDLRGLDAQAIEQSIKAELQRVASPPLPPAALHVVNDEVEFVKGLYCGEIEYLDRHVGELVRHIERAGLAAKTYIIFTSDHGEELLEHGWWGHGSFLFDESIHVPLLILGPGITPARVSEQVENLRVYQTALRLLGDRRAEWEFRGPLPPWGETRRYAYSSTWKGIRAIQPRFVGKQLYAVQSERAKLILETDEDLKPIGWTRFELPGEQAGTPLLTGADRDLEEKLRTWFRYCAAHSMVGPAALSPQQAENLNKLGYVGPGGGTATGLPPRSEGSAKDGASRK